jgi:Leucine-rich repeat (LRR) protein
VKWFNQMPLLEHIYLSSNDLTDLRYDTFNHLSHLRNLDVARNSLRTIELWTVQIEDTVNYQFNRIDRFSNKYNVDLSQIQSETIPEFYTYGNLRIQFDDTIFAMYNRCAEVHNSGNRPILTLSVLSIIEDTNDEQPFYQSCSCDQYYFYRTAFTIREYLNNSSFDHWICPGHSIPFIQHCNNRSSANFIDVLPRLCKIDESEPGEIPVFVSEPQFVSILKSYVLLKNTFVSDDYNSNWVNDTNYNNYDR